MTDTVNLARILKSDVPIFAGFSDHDLRKVTAACRTDTFEQGDVLVKAGSESTELLLILSGTAIVRADSGAAIARLAEPETIGEMGVLTGEPRSATVDAFRPCECAVISRDALQEILRDSPPAYSQLHQNVIKVLADRLIKENLQLQMFMDRLDELESDMPVPESVKAAAKTVDEETTIAGFYEMIGQREVPPEQYERDHQAYAFMRQRGYSDRQILYASQWTVENIRGCRRFLVVKYCVDDALEERKR